MSSSTQVLSCAFQAHGFGKFPPCNVTYHATCISVGAPFTTRRARSAGLSFPAVGQWGTFICELCTVRGIIGREVTGRDIPLLQLERMRLIDMAWSWSANTHVSYQSKLRAIRRFEQSYGLSILAPTLLQVPPSTPDIPLMWCMEASSLRSGTSRNGGRISFSTVRLFRSAASQFWAWDGLIAHPSAALMTQEGRLSFQACRATDSHGFTLFATGLSARMGTSVAPSKALLSRHVHALDTFLETAFQAAPRPLRLELALAALANLFFWLGWLRTSEAFGLSWKDVEVLHPANAAEQDLPANVGLLSLRLLPETKSSRTHRPDVIIAYRSASGLCPGRWFHRAHALRPSTARPASLLFRHSDGSPWSSLYFRQRFLYPSLRRQFASGDQYLHAASPSVEVQFWSLHCYRRGARTHVSRAPPGRTRPTTEQIYEHARWRYSRSSQPIDALYRDWTPFDRVKITHMCQ